MRVSELLFTVARWLESPENEVLMLSEDHPDCLSSVAKTCILAAEVLKCGAEEAEALEPKEESKLTPEALDHLNAIVSAFDRSGDEELQKTASVIDELLLTISTPPQWAANFKQAEEKKIDELKTKYQDVNKQLHLENKTEETAKKIDASPMFAEVRQIAPSLSTRSCPEHPGCGLFRVGDHEYKCSLDGKVFNWAQGFTTDRGVKYPGGDPSHQFDSPHPEPHSIFDTREDRTRDFTPNK